MSTINPTNLKQLRKQRHLSLTQLAEKARVDRGTIHRIESGTRRSTRSETAARLAKALDTDVDALTGPSLDPSGLPEVSPKSQMNIRMSNDARNALNLVAMRYEVKASTIIHLAPLLFLWAAEESLKRRSARLDVLEQQWNALPSHSDFPHLDGSVAYSSRAEEIISSERQSIKKRDIFGMTIPDDEIVWDYEESEQNPMARFMADLVADMGELAQFEYWSPNWDQPGYTLGREEAGRLVEGDEDAVHHIVCGNVGLHEIPKEILAEGSKATANWVRERGETHAANMSELLAGIRI